MYWWPFSKKVLVPISTHFEQILDNMTNDRELHDDLWKYISKKFGVTRKYSWRNSTNYLVFKNDKEYLLFLLKL